MSVLQFPSLERDIEHWTNKTVGCVHFPVFFVLENFCPQAFVCAQSAHFVREDLTYLFFFLLCNYVHINLVRCRT